MHGAAITLKKGLRPPTVWSGAARGTTSRGMCRAAYRFNDEPADRGDDVGCRLAEFKSGREPSVQSRERGRERGAGRGATEDRDQASAAGWINLDAPGKSGLAFAAVTPRRIASDVEQIVLGTMRLPEWASAIGRDKYGLWAELTLEGKAARAPAKRRGKTKSAPPASPIGPVRQRLRWIPPGRFLMGSPPEEEGRYDWEQLPHEVLIDEGFWMFAAPCTQALWEALMHENPSGFKSPDRPVENVSWNDCQEFVTELNKHINGLELSLPSEAQWEYACRAGTMTSTYAGPLEIKGANNAPLLDAIACYGGNSGHEFDLENGYDASGWEQKQYAFDKAGTRPVAKKRANRWGLYDMLGNVWEWCADEWVHGASGEASADRVVRGGSWYGGAQDCARGVPLQRRAGGPGRRCRLPSCRVQEES